LKGCKIGGKGEIGLKISKTTKMWKLIFGNCPALTKHLKQTFATNL
jgi:hypothetical protein